MRIQLDESVPGRLAGLLPGHLAVTVQSRGWASMKNGKLLALAAAEFDVLLTADKAWRISRTWLRCPCRYS